MSMLTKLSPMTHFALAKLTHKMHGKMKQPNNTSAVTHSRKQHTKRTSWYEHSYQHLSLSVDNQILTLMLDRGEKKNALSFALVNELLDVGACLKKDRQIRAVIICGAGDAFCTGMDLADLNNPKNMLLAVWELAKPAKSVFQQVCLIWREVPMPVIVAMHGYCLGAGLQLALAADIRVATPDCQLAIMEAKWGLVPDMGLTQSALQVVRPDILKELVMSARIIDATKAEQLGLITHISDTPNVLANTLAMEFATRSPDAVLAGKRVVNRMTEQRFSVLYTEKMWQLKLMLGRNRKRALKRVKDDSVSFFTRQFK